MRQSRWFAKRRRDDNAEKEENRYEGRRSDGKRGRVPWRWRRESSEGYRRGSTESSAEHKTGPLAHGLF
ncbi:MAG: hypothetical protein Q7U39_03460 [Nitrospira sp.]|nr:hypothetical protein [Nitrospira sp.]